MKYALIGLALLVVSSAAHAQTSSTTPPANPLAVTPVEPGKTAQDSPEASAVRSRLEAFGYGNVSDLDRDSTGRWHARATKDNTTVSVIVDKGGRIIPQRH